MPSDPPIRLPEFLERWRVALPGDLSFAASRLPYLQWADGLRRHWLSGLPPCSGPAEAEEAGGDITLNFATGAQAQGRFLRPSGNGPFPAVLLCHDHGGRFDIGWRKMCDDPASVGTRAALYDGLAVAEAFVDAGFAVLCVDALGWGGRQCGGYAGQQALASAAMGLGWSLAGLVAAEDVQAAAWLAAHPAVDAQRITSFGFSFGGLRAWQVAALSPHVRAAASASWMARRADLMAPGAPLLSGQSAFYMLYPHLAGRADFPDLAGLAAGKPLFFRSGHGDRHMPVDSVRRAFDQITTIAKAAGGPVPDTGFHDAGHTCPAEVTRAAIAFLQSA